MQEIADRNLCSGCHACYNACPKQCIEMKEDENGFLYPVIDSKQCIDCGLCKKICPVNNTPERHETGIAYACINTDADTRISSSSGGVFSLLAEEIIKQGGVVFGAGIDKSLSVKHTEITKLDEIKLLRGSKYVQSEIGDTYRMAKEHLESGRLVLFSGTPCQISGIKAFLKKDYDNLLLQDIICHGVPSPKIWKVYLKFQEYMNKIGEDCTPIPSFRNKKKGWKEFSMELIFESGVIYSKSLKEDSFLKAFLSNLSLRMSCYNCSSKSLNRESDITLADFWGIENINPDMYDNKGTSLVIINSDKGQKFFDLISDRMKISAVDLKEAVKYNSAAYESVKMPKNREKFFKEVNSDCFDEVVEKYTKQSFFEIQMLRIKSLLNKMRR